MIKKVSQDDIDDDGSLEKNALLGEASSNPMDDGVSGIEGDGKPPKSGLRYRFMRNLNKSSHQAALSIYINLINTTVGAGCLTLPYTLSLVGFLPGLGLNLLVAIFSAYTLTLLVEAAYKTQCYSFKDLGTKLFGYRIVGIIFQFTVFCQNFGIMCGYTVIAGEFVSMQVRDWMAKEDHLLNWFELILQSEYFWMTACIMFVMFPLSLLRNMKLLSYTSALSLFCIVYMIVAIVVNFFTLPRASPVWVGVDPVGWLVSCPLMFLAYGSHNCVLPIVDDVKHRLGPRTVSYISMMVVMTVFTAYATMCLTSHFIFGTQTDDNVLNGFDVDNISIFVAKCAISFVIMVSYPIFCFASRHAIENTVFARFKFNWIRWILITAALCFVCLGLAAAVPFISTIFSFVGAIFSVLINFVYPLIIKIKIDKRWYVRLIHIFLLLVALLIGPLCLGGVIIDTVQKEINRHE